MAFGQSNSSWTILEDKGEPQPAGVKWKVATGGKQHPKVKKAKPASTTPKRKPLQRKLAPEMDETENKEDHAPIPPYHSPSVEEVPYFPRRSPPISEPAT